MMGNFLIKLLVGLDAWMGLVGDEEGLIGEDIDKDLIGAVMDEELVVVVMVVVVSDCMSSSLLLSSSLS